MLLTSIFSQKTYPSESEYSPVFDGLTLTGLDASKMVMTDANKKLASTGELRLTPQVESSGPEGTVFYASDDDHLYVGTE
jgi:hypothetical protein